MPTDVIMPNLGLTMETGTVQRWLASPGERVEAGQPILEVETDKVVVEVEALASGLLGSPLVPEGESVPIGTVLARIYDPGERQREAETGRHGEPAREEPLSPAVQQMRSKPPGASTGRESVGENLLERVRGGLGAWRDVRGTGPAERVFSSPRARRRAREAGLDWRTVSGSGPMGRVIERDVLRAASRDWGPGIGSQHPQPARTPAEEVGPRSASHLYLSAKARADALLGLRERLLIAVERQTGIRLTVTDLLVKIVSAALVEHPGANAFWDATAGRVRLQERINVGVAVATENGLVAPALRDANHLSLTQIAAERQRLTDLARNGELRPEDLDWGTFTLTDLGVYRVDVYQAHLGPSQSAALTVSRIVERPVAIDGHLSVRPTMVITLSRDPRVLDDLTAAQFLDRVVELIEEPALLMA